MFSPLGANTVWERLVGVEPPHGPPYNTLGGSFLVSFTGKFAGNLEWIACKLISLFVIFFHVSYSNMHVVLFEENSILPLPERPESPGWQFLRVEVSQES